MAFTTSDLDAINAAIGSGALRVKYADREVTYQTMDDLLKAKAVIEAELGITRVNRGRRFATFSKGFE